MKESFEVLKGDSFKIMSELKPGTFDFIFADPPYLLSNNGLSVKSGKQVSVNKGDWDKSQGFDADLDFHLKWIALAKDLLSANGTLAISGTRHSIYKCGIALEMLGFRILNEIIWFKPNGAPNLTGRNFAESHETIIWASKSKTAKHTFNYEAMKVYDQSGDKLKAEGKQMRDVWSIPTTPMREKEHGKHPTQKPLELLERLVLACSNEGDLVLDPFCGSGTTGVASVKHNRRFVGIEKDPEYCRLTTKRITGQLKEAAIDKGRQGRS
jgi:site-specific DNA-methyltransferase (adenine-specific)